MVSSQVINECVNVCLKKFKFDKSQAYAFADTVMNKVNVVPVALLHKQPPRPDRLKA